MEGLNYQLSEGKSGGGTSEGRSNQMFEEGGVQQSGRRSSNIGQGIPVTGDISSTDGVKIERFD